MVETTHSIVLGFGRQISVCWLKGCAILAQLGEEAAGEAVAADQKIAPEMQSPVLQFLSSPLSLILFSAILFMFLVVRPQQKQMKELQKALAGLKKNDRVVLASGIHGTVVQASPGEAVVMVRIDENTGTRITVNRDSVAKVIADGKE